MRILSHRSNSKITGNTWEHTPFSYVAVSLSVRSVPFFVQLQVIPSVYFLSVASRRVDKLYGQHFGSQEPVM